MYGTPPILGAVLYVTLENAFPNIEGLSAFCGFALTVAVRAAAWTWDIKWPSWLLEAHSAATDTPGGSDFTEKGTLSP